MMLSRRSLQETPVPTASGTAGAVIPARRAATVAGSTRYSDTNGGAMSRVSSPAVTSMAANTPSVRAPRMPRRSVLRTATTTWDTTRGTTVSWSAAIQRPPIGLSDLASVATQGAPDPCNAIPSPSPTMSAVRDQAVTRRLPSLGPGAIRIAGIELLAVALLYPKRPSGQHLTSARGFEHIADFVVAGL